MPPAAVPHPLPRLLLLLPPLPPPASSAAADSDLAYIQSNGKMVIGYTVYEPMNYTDADGGFTGFEYRAGHRCL